MAQLISVKLSRFDASPWGFRLQGGKDFGAPLLIQKVNGGSPAEKAGLQAGDAVIKVNEVELFNLRHKEAQDQIVRAGNNFELTVQRGGSTWKPQVTPIGPAPVAFNAGGNVQPVTKTSLAAKKQDVPQIGSAHNFAPKPYGGAQVNGIGDPTVKSIVNKQYNTPVGMYSEETIAETLSAQAEVLAGGVLGVNFKKNERTYTPGSSEVLKMVQEIDSEPKTPEPERPASTTFFATASHAVGGRATSPRPQTPIAQQFSSSAPSSHLPTNVPSVTPKCSDCDKFIVGGRAPAGAISAALGKAPASTFAPAQARAPAPAPTYAPAPAPARAPVSVPAPAPAPAPSNLAGPRPFSTPSAPTTSPARPAPAGSKFVWPPSRTEDEPSLAPTASPLYIPPSPAGSGPGTPTGPAPKIPPVAAIKSVPAPAPVPVAPAPAFAPAPAPAPAPVFAPTFAPAPAPATQSFPQTSSQAVPFPQPFSVFLAKQQPPMRPISSPVPVEKSLPQSVSFPEFQQPLLPAELAPISVEESEDLKAAQDAAFRKKYSMCSQEVLAINKDKPGPRFETLSETLETQMLVTSLTPEPVKRPESPIPMQDSKTSSIQDLPKLIEQVNPTSQPEEQVKTVATETVAPEITSIPSTEAVPPIAEAAPISIKAPPQPSDPSEVSYENPQLVDSSSINAQSEVTVKAQSDIVSISEQSFSSQKSEFPETKSSSQITIEKEEVQHSQLLSALTTASERPYSPLPSAGILSQSEVIAQTQSEVISKSEQTFISESQASSQISSQSVSGFVPVSREQEQFATQFQQQTRQISSQQSSSVTSAFTTSESIQSSASFIQDRAAACPSPMLSALTIASDQPYSSLPSATLPMAPVPMQSGAINTLAAHPTPVKPIVPAPLPTSVLSPQASLSREAACPSPMLSALTVASDRPYSPLPSATKSMISAPVQSAPINTQPTFPVAIMPIVPAPVPMSMAPAVAQAPLAPPSREAACPSPMLSALTIAPDRPYSPLPSATKTMFTAPTQSAPISTPAVLPPSARPISPLPPGVTAPLARGGAYPSVTKAAPLATPAFKPAALPAQPLPKFKPQAPVPQTTPFKAVAPAHKAPAAFKPMAPAPQAAPIFKPQAPAPKAPSAFKPQAPASQAPSAFKPQALAPQAPSAFKPQALAPQAPSAFKPQVPAASRPLGPAPLPLPQNPPALKPVIPAAIAANIQGQAPMDRQAACPSPMLSALTIAPDRPYSPLPSATKAGFAPVQTSVRRTSAPVSAPVKFTPSGMKPPEKTLRDETQLPLLTRPAQQVPKVSAVVSVPALPTTKFPTKPAPPVQEPAPIVKPASATALPVYGGFRPIVAPSTGAGFKPIQYEELDNLPSSNELTPQYSAPPPARPKTPVQRVETPTPRSRSATPRSASRLGLQKPAAIPYYQQEMGEYPGQSPRSATPTCPMLEPRPQTPKVQLTKPEVPYVPQKPSASFQRQAPPTKPYASYQPQPGPQKPVQFQQPAHAAPQLTPVPFPNIPLPEGFDPDSMMFKPVAQPVKPTAVPQQTFLPQQQSAPIKPSPLAAPLKPSPLAAPQPASSAPIFKPSPLAAPAPAAPAPVPAAPKTIPVMATQPTSVAKTPSVPSSSSLPNAGGGGGSAPGGAGKGASVAGSTAPRRGRGVLTQQSAGGRIPVCAQCSSQIRGPFITALGKNWCPEHFVCVNAQCRRPLADIGFVEEKGELYCEYCFEKYLAPTCNKCNNKIKGDCLNAIGKHFHPECFLCAYCGKLFGNNPFFLEDGLPYCEADWNELFTTKCFACGFPIEAGDRWVEALNNNYHSQCFNCTNCKKNLEGQSFYAKGGRPFCKAHAR